MSQHTRTIAGAFSSHRFAETHDHLDESVVWIGVGEGTTTGKDAVIAVCESTTAELAATTTEFTRFVVVADDAAAAVDVTARYTDNDGTSVVSSCDIYEFRDDRIVRITSYAVEVTSDPSTGRAEQTR